MKLDIDTFLILTLPLFAGIILIFLPQDAIFFTIGLTMSIMAYLIIIHPKKEIYGFSGLKILTIPSLILLAYTLIIAIPSIYICLIKETPAVYPYFYTVCGFYIFLSLGYRLGDKLWKIDIHAVQKIQKQPYHKTPIDYLIGESLWFLLITGIAIYIIYVTQLKKIPIIELLTSTGDAAAFSLLRQESFKLLKVPAIIKYFVQWERFLLMPFGIITSLFFYVVYGKKKYLIFFWVFFLVGLTFNSLTIEKSPTATIFMALMAFFYLRKKVFSLKYAFFSVIVVLVIPIFIIYMKFSAEHDKIADFIAQSLFERIFLIPTQMLYEHFVIFPQKVGFLLGRSSQLFSWMYASDSINLPQLVATIYYKNPHTVVYLNAMYLANFWADFGTIGVILSTVAVGLIVHWITYKLFTVSGYQKSVLFVVITSITMPHFSIQFLSANITILFFTSGLMLLIFLLIGINLLKKRYPKLAIG